MPYNLLNIRVEGASRGTGHQNPIASAAAVLIQPPEPIRIYAQNLPSFPVPTNQRAELTAITLALRVALGRYSELRSNFGLRVVISVNSRYAHNCVTMWGRHWRFNGWVNYDGTQVANRDLIERALDLDTQLRQFGEVKYVRSPIEHGQSQMAAGAVMPALDGQEWEAVCTSDSA